MSHSLIVEADGGSRGNPGVAGYGALVRDADTGDVLAERAAPLGKESNNVAEYTGLVEGLRAVVEHQTDAAVLVRMDSKLVIEQMSGRWKIKHEDMKRLAAQARELVAEIKAAGGGVRFEWIPREKNKAADKLSNDGMDGVTVRRDMWATTDVAPKSEAATHELLQQQTEPSLKRPTRIILVRHAVTDYTERGLLDGRSGADPALSETGRAQAERVARGIAGLVDEPVSVISSTLRRAQETAEPIAQRLGVDVVTEADWEEQCFGDWDGKSFRELHEQDPEALAALRLQPDYAVAAGESRNDLDARVHRAFDQAVARGGCVVVVTHRIAIMSVLSRVLGLDMAGAWRLAAAPASFTGLEVWPDGNAQVAFLNDTHHLR